MFLFTSLAPAAQQFDGIFYPEIFSVKYGYAATIIFTMIVNVMLVLFSTKVFATQDIRIFGEWAAYRGFIQPSKKQTLA